MAFQNRQPTFQQGHVESRSLAGETYLNRWKPAQQSQALYFTCLPQLLVVCPCQ